MGFSTILWFFSLSTTIKLLLIPSYHSTDLEVHRHWLALTSSLPLSRWYSDLTSPWTLDYPPFFAFFELSLSPLARLLDPQITHLHLGLNYSSPSLLYFQRLSVIFSDFLLLFAVFRLTRCLGDSRRKILIWVLILSSPGLFIVDHVHFQYNGFLLGLLLLSVSFLQEGRDLLAGFVFAVLLCFKHLFAVAAPLYFVYLLRHYCWKGGFIKGFVRLSAMGAVVVAVFVVAFGPFVYHGQMQQVISRMFPFGRGLCHAYWAPNFWVFYILLDKGLAFALKRFGFHVRVPTASFTGGLVGDSSPFAVLPQITPLTTLMMVLLALAPCLYKAWKNPQPSLVARWVAYAYTCGFMFGWHVHEKASLHFVIPLAVVAVQSLEDARHYLLLSIASCYSLFPLLYEAQEYPIKVLLLLLHSILMWHGFSGLFTEDTEAKFEASNTKREDGSRLLNRSPHVLSGDRRFTIGSVGMFYLFGIVIVETWAQFLHPYIMGDNLPFVPLILISSYCALEITYSWIWQLRWIMMRP